MRIVLDGENISANNIPIYEAIKILQSIQNMASLINEINEKGPYANLKPSQLNPKKVTLAVTSISPGCAVLNVEPFNPQLGLVGVKSNSQQVLEQMEKLFVSISENNSDSVISMFPYSEQRESVLKQVKYMLHTDSVSVGILTSDDKDITFGKEWEDLIYSLSRVEKEVFRARVIGFLNVVDSRRFRGEIRTGDYYISFKDPIIGEKLQQYYNKSVYIEGEFQLTTFKKKGLILVGINNIRELLDRIEVNELQYKDKVYVFTKPLGITTSKLEDGTYEVAAPEIKVRGYGKHFEDALLDLKEIFANAYYLIKYSGEPISRESRSIVEFINKHCCEVKPFGC
jgi:hypothetical protein